jgi:hypothetical protein
VRLDAPGWLVTWLQSINAWDLVLLAVGVAGAVVFIRKKGWRWLKSFAKAILKTADVIDHVQELPQFIARTDAAVEQMRRQLENSHVTNLRDDVTEAIDTAKRVEEGVSGLHGRLDEVERNVAALSKADVEIRAELQVTHPSKESS